MIWMVKHMGCRDVIISEEGIHHGKQMCFIILGQLLYIDYTLYNTGENHSQKAKGSN
jgi:hypothetical protein